jgi:hypothetical protein
LFFLYHKNPTKTPPLRSLGGIYPEISPFGDRHRLRLNYIKRQHFSEEQINVG